MRLRHVLLSLLLSLPCFGFRTGSKYHATVLYDDLVIGGRNAEPGEFPEVLFVRATASRCTATVVGPNMVLTAAHCAHEGERIYSARSWEKPHEEFQLDALCTRHPKYSLQKGYDLALCNTWQPMGIRPARIAGAEDAPLRNDDVFLLGYGGTIIGGGGGNDGILRVGKARIDALPTLYRKWFIVDGDSALSFGDSGGPTMKWMRHTRAGEHTVLGVNSRGNILDTSLIAPVYTEKARKWMHDVSARTGAKICGISINQEGCDGEEDPPSPYEAKESGCVSPDCIAGVTATIGRVIEIVLALTLSHPKKKESL